MLPRRCSFVGLIVIAAAVVFPSESMAQPLAPGQTLPPVQGPMPPPAAPQVPFVLTAQEQASLDLLLRAWEHHSGLIQTFSCNFTKYEYNAVWIQSPPHRKAVSEGELKFSKPDKGMYHIVAVDGKKSDDGDYWVCDGKSIYVKDYSTKTVKEVRLPPEMQGKAISDGPLPFVFGVEADKLKQRYWMRITTPAGVQGQVWLEALPKFGRDAQNFRKVEIVLSDKDLTPLAIQIYQPEDDSPRKKVTDVYALRDLKKNAMVDRLLEFTRNFVAPPTPPFWKHVVEETSATAQAERPGLPTGGQVERPLVMPPRR